MNQEIDIVEYKNRLKKMLKYLNDICRKNNIKYSLDAGSLIGAVREGGIIPWDDDIDIIFIPDQLQKFIKCVEEDNNSNYKILMNSNNKTYYYPYPKLVDLTTIVYEKNNKKITDYGIFIDLFQYNNLPNNKFLTYIYIKRIKFYQQLIKGYAQIKADSLLKKIRNIFANIIGIEKIVKGFNKFTEKYNNKSTEYIISNWPIYKDKKEIQEGKDIKEIIDTNFENMNVMIFKNYDSILSKRYGNYMLRPPKEKQISNHDILAYKRKGE